MPLLLRRLAAGLSFVFALPLAAAAQPAADHHQHLFSPSLAALISVAAHGGARAQFAFGFRQGDIQALFAGCRPRHQELKGDRRLAGAWIAFDKKNMTRCETAHKYIVKTGDPGLGLDRPVIRH